MPLFRTKKSSATVDESNPYWISFSDIMSGLLVIFILASLQLILELSEKNEQVDAAIQEVVRGDKVRAEMLDEIRLDLAKQGIQVAVAENQSVLRIPDDQISFSSSHYDIPENRRQAVQIIGKALYEAITKDGRSRYIDTIFVEGHTDSIPAPGLVMGNWGLSSYRAIAVWNTWKSNAQYGHAMVALKNREKKPMFSVSGYAATRPKVEIDDTAEKRQQNRRIDVRITMRQPNLIDLDNIRKILGQNNGR